MRFSVSIVAALCTLATSAHAGAFNERAGQALVIATLARSSASQVFALDGVSRLPTHFALRKLDLQLYAGLTPHLMAIVKTERLAATGTAEARFTGSGPTSIGLQWQLGKLERTTFALQGMVHLPSPAMTTAPWLFGQTANELELRLLAGRNYIVMGRRGFVDVQVGSRHRSAGLGREWHLDVTHGIELTRRTKLLTQSFTTWASATPANDFALFEQRKQQISLLRDFGSLSLQAGIYRTMSGRHAYVERGSFLALWLRL